MVSCRKKFDTETSAENQKQTTEGSIDIPRGRNNEYVERRTSNFQHRTSNIDDAALYPFLNRQITEFRRLDPHCPIFLFKNARIHYSMLNVRCSMFDVYFFSFFHNRQLSAYGVYPRQLVVKKSRIDT